MAGSLAGGFGEFTGAGNDNSGEEVLNIVEGTGSHRRWFKGPWDTRYDFVEEELLVAAGTFPARHPDNPLLFIHVIRIKGLGESSWDDDNKKTTWERALVIAEYKTFEGSTGGDDPDSGTPEDYAKQKFVEESADSNIELITIPGEEIKKESDGLKLHMKGPFHRPFITESINIKIPRVLNPPWYAYNYLAGRINDSAFITPSGRAFQVGTLRFDGFTSETKINLNFNLTGVDEDEIIAPFYTLNLKFEYNWHGWNRKFIDGTWEDIQLSSNDNPLLVEDDLWTLFFGYNPANGFNSGSLDDINTILASIRTSLETGLSITDLSIRALMQSAQILIQDLGFKVELIP